MYGVHKTNLSKRVIKYQFDWEGSDSRKITYAEFINLLKAKDKDFFRVFREALEDGNNELKAYFWECPPVSKATRNNRPFEFVLTQSEGLKSIRQNYSSFSEYFSKDINSSVVSFKNWGKDATLIVPVPQKSSDDDLSYMGWQKELDYKNISNFTKNAPLEKQHEFWQKVVNELERDLNNSEGTPKWLSTHGMGVYYLHVRVDSKPRYYSCEEYKKEKVEGWAREDIVSSQHGIYSGVENIQEVPQQGKQDELTQYSTNFNHNPQLLTNSEIIQDVRENGNKSWRIDEVITEYDGLGRGTKREKALIHNSAEVGYDGVVSNWQQQIHLSKRFNQLEITEIENSLKDYQLPTELEKWGQEDVYQSSGSPADSYVNQEIRQEIVDNINWGGFTLYNITFGGNVPDEEWFIHNSYEIINNEVRFDAEKMYKVKDLTETEKQLVGHKSEANLKKLSISTTFKNNQKDKDNKESGMGRILAIIGMVSVVVIAGLVVVRKKLSKKFKNKN